MSYTFFKHRFVFSIKYWFNTSFFRFHIGFQQCFLMFKRQRLPIGIGDPVNGLKEQEIKDDLNNHEHNGTNIEHIR